MSRILTFAPGVMFGGNFTKPKKTEETEMEQEKNAANLEFVRRVDNYQAFTELSKSEACKRIGISQSRLSEIRNSQVPVSAKFWMRLEAAESRVGIRIRDRSLPSLKDVPLEKQPSNQQLAALKREEDPVIRRLNTFRESGKLLELLLPNDAESQDAILDLIVELISLSGRAARIEDNLDRRLSRIEQKLSRFLDQHNQTSNDDTAT